MSNEPPLALAVVALLLLAATIYLLRRDKILLEQARAFMALRKRWWLGPIVVMVALLSLLVVFTQNGRAARFIYTLL
jgi:hypothetical protein